MNPTFAGQIVKDEHGTIGITTSGPDKRGNIGVMLRGMPYDIKVSASSLQRIEVIEK